MNYLKLSEKVLKRNFKRKRTITIAVIVSFLITGGIGYFSEEIFARDLRSRNPEKNRVTPAADGPGMNTSANNTDVVNIVNPDQNGISHNKFIDLNIGSGNGLIFNNNTENGVSQIGGYVTKNPNLKNSANTILSEVTGNNVSNINGSVEIFGKRADFILANENGINVNGATFINTSGVTLTTGRVTSNNSGINFDVEKGHILLNGVGTSGNYFNVLAKTIEIHKEVSPIEGEKNPDISLIAGENKILAKNRNLNSLDIIESKKSKSDKYGIYATELGAMYGKNIRLISTDNGLGVKHEGIILSEKDIEISSEGDIVLASVNSKGKLNIKGESLTTFGGTTKVGDKEYINSLSSNGDLNLNIGGDIVLNAGVQTTEGNIKITAKGLKLSDKTSARIIGKKSITINLSEKLDVQGVMIPTISGVDSNNLVIFSDKNGKIKVKDVKSGKIYDENQITWVSTGIIGSQVDIFVKNLENKGIISADKSLKITGDNILNDKSGVIKSANLDIKANKSFVNKGEFRQNRKELGEFVDSNGKLKVTVSLGEFENYGNISAKNLEIISQELINAFTGKIIVTDGDIILTTTVGDLINNGEIFTNNNVQIVSSKNIVNTGKIGGDNISFKGINGEFINAGNITAIKNLEIIVDSLKNSGTNEELEKYLNIFYNFSETTLENVEKTIKDLKNKINSEKDPTKLAGLKESLKYFEEVKVQLIKLKEELGKSGNLGTISSKEIKIIANNDIKNEGLLTAENNIDIKGKNIENNGILQAGKNMILEAVEKIVNTQRITAGGDINIKAKEFLSSGDKDLITEYLSLLQKYDETRVTLLEKDILELEKKLSMETDTKLILEIKIKLDKYRKELKELKDIKAQISSFKNLGVLEGNNVVINTISELSNDGIIIAQGGLELKSEGAIKNSGAITVGKSLDVVGDSFLSNSLTVKEKLNAKVNESFISNDLIVGDNITIKGKEFVSNGELTSNGSLDVEGDVKLGEKTTIKKDVAVKGGFSNRGELAIGGNLDVTDKNKMFENNGNVEIGGKLEIDSNGVINNGNINTVAGIDIDVVSDIKNTGKLQSKGDIILKGQTAENSGDIITDGSFSGTIKDKFINNNLSVRDEVIIESGSFVNKGNTISNKQISIVSGGIENQGKIHGNEEIELKANNLDNHGEIIGNGLDIQLNGNLKNNGSLQSNKNISIKNIGANNKIESSGDIKAVDNIDILAKDSNFVNNGKILTEKKLSIDVKSMKNTDEVKGKGIAIETSQLINNGKLSSTQDVTIDLKNSQKSSGVGNIVANSGITIGNSRGDITTGKVQSPNDISIKTSGNIINKGMIVGNNDILLEGNSVTNEAGNTIWAGQNLVINAIKEIYNGLKSLIESKGDMKLTAKSIVNDAGVIRAGKDLNIKTDSLLNKSVVEESNLINGFNSYEEVTRWDDIFNYHLDFVKIEIPNIVNNSVVKDKASIEAGGNLTITGMSGEKANVINESGTISARRDITIVGDVTNKTDYQEITVEWLLENITVTLHWETRLYLTNAYGNSGVTFKGTLKEALYGGYFSGKEAYYQSLIKVNNPLLNKVLSSFLGPDWKAHNNPVSQDRWNKDGAFKYYAANGNAKILAGGNLNHSNGFFNNAGGESGGNKNITVEIGDNTVEGIGSGLDANIGDINSIKEVDGIKQIHDVEIISGEVTLNGITIKAESGNTAGSIAVAGTINPIIFIDIPSGENGIFKPADPKPGKIPVLYETNIEFIDPDNFYGSQYFFDQIGYDKDRTSTVIGDAYYEYLLLTKMIKEGIGYTGEITADMIKNLLDNGLKLSDQLGLEIGKPLKPEQINALDKDIIWYVEIEVNGQKVLTPQIYFSNKSRIEISQSQGNGGAADVKVGGDFISDADSFNNSNGNITADGNIIIKSQGDINNNSSGSINGGITSNNGNIALDGNGDVNIKGGSVKGDNVIISGDNVNIESKLGTDSSGNQIISDKGSIEANNGIQIDSKNDVNIKGGSLTASGTEVKPEEEGMGGGIQEEKPEEPKVEKNIDFYKKLFEKEAKDIIDGPAGSINIKAGGDVNIEDIYTVSSDREDEYGHFESKSSVSSSAKSNGSEILGSNINIDSENDINIKGSSIATNDTQEEEEKLPGSININAKNNVNISDSQEVSYESSSSSKTSVEEGLLTVKTSNYEKNSSISKGSSIATGGNLTITSGNDVTIKGSDLGALGDTTISAKNDINIVDGRDEITENSQDTRYQVVGGGVTKSEKYSSTSKGSSIATGGNLTIDSGNNIKIVNGSIGASRDTTISAKNDISIEAGRNEYHETTTTTNVGIYVEGSVGVGGVGVTGNGYTGDMSVNGEISDQWGGESEVGENLDGSNEKTPTTSGKPHMDQLVNSEVGLKIENIKKEITEKTWTESNITGENITIKAGGTADIGGGDYKANGDINIEAKQVETTKYEDEKEEKTDGFTFAVKQSQGVNSAIADTINTGLKMDEAIKSGQANDGVLAAQGVGAISNIIFNDLAGVFSKQSVNVSVENTQKTETSENTTSLDGKNINIKATEGDINLKGVDIKAQEDISLEAKKDINITSNKSTSTEKGTKVDLEAQLEQTAGYSALWGGNTDVGVGGSVNVDITSKSSETNNNSTINAGGNINIKSGGDTNIKGGEVEAKKDVNVDVGGSLNIESKKSTSREDSINANAGGNVSIGGSTNTIGKGELGFSAGGGNIWKDSETVDQSVIKAGGSLNVNVKEDVNIKGGILGSETENGSLNVGGNLNIEDITTSEKQGGAHITVSGGFTGDMGVDGTIGDEQDRNVTSKGVIGLDKDNINIGGDVNINGETSSKDDIYTDVDNTQIVNKDEYKKGGDISLSGSTSNVKDVKDKVNEIKNKVKGGSSSTKKDDSDIKLPDRNLETNNKQINDKYEVLDKDNAFDFPKDDGIREEIVDKVGETPIIPEYYEPLQKEPPVYKNPPEYPTEKGKTPPVYKNPPEYGANNPDVNLKSNNKDLELSSKLDSIQKDIERVEKIEKITGGDFGTKSALDDLRGKESKIKDEILKKELPNLNIEDREQFKKLEKGLEALTKKQEDLLKKQPLKQEERDTLEKIEKELQETLGGINNILAKEKGEVTLPKQNEDKYKVLDEENAFDFPQDDGIREEIVDKAGEEPIVAEHYEPLRGNPEDYKEPNLSELEKKKQEIERDIERVERIESITGGDLATGTSLDRLKTKLEEIKEKISAKENEQLSSIPKDLQDKYKELANKLDNLVKSQETLLSSQPLSLEKQKELNRIEKEIEYTISGINAIERGEEVREKVESEKVRDEESLIDNDALLVEKNSQSIIDLTKELEKVEIKEKLSTYEKIKLELIPGKSVNDALKKVQSLKDKLSKEQDKVKRDELLDKLNDEIDKLREMESKLLEKYQNSGKNEETLDKLQNGISEANKAYRQEVEKDILGIKSLIKDKITEKNKTREEDKVIEIMGRSDSQTENTLENKYDFSNKDIDEVILITKGALDEALVKQKEIIEKYDKDKKGKYKLDQEIKELKKELEKYSETNKNKKVSEEQERNIKVALEKLEKYEKNNEKYLSGKPQENEKIDSKLTILTRSDRDVFQNLKSVAKESDKIPKEHLLDYLNKILKNTEQKEAVENLTGEKPEVILGIPKIEHNEESEKDLNKIYKDIFERTDSGLREALDDEFKNMMQSDRELQKLLKNKDTSPEKIKELAEKIQDIKSEAFETVLGVEYKRVDVEVLPPKDDLVGGNDGTTFKIYLDEQDSFEYLFKTIIHELTHQDQNNLKDIKVEGFEDRSELYKLNSMNGGYITIDTGDEYKTQPIEKEAHEAEKLAEEILKSVEQEMGSSAYELPPISYGDSDSEDEIDFASFVKSQFNKEEDKYGILDESNAFDFPQDDGIREEIVDKAGEEPVVAEHYEPLRGNPEDYKEPSLSELEKKKQEIEKDIKRVEKIESITGGDLATGTSLDRLKTKLKEIKEEILVKENEQLSGIPKDLQDKYKELGNKLDNLVKSQENLLLSQPLSQEKQEELSRLEKEIENTISGINAIERGEKAAEKNIIPVKNNNNLEKGNQKKELGNYPVIYGTSQGRRELVGAAEQSPNTNNTVPDAFLGVLNLGYQKINIAEFAKKVNNGTLTDADIDKLVSYKDLNLDNDRRSYVNRQISKAPEEANRELIREMLKDPKIKDILKELEPAFNELVDKDELGGDSSKEQERYDKLLLDFFTVKTLAVLNKTLNGEGQVYFSLNGIVKDKDGNIDFDKLLEVFNPDSPIYGSVTSAELRTVFSKYMDHPNVKFFLDKQVIELPEDIKEKLQDKVEQNKNIIKEEVKNEEKTNESSLVKEEKVELEKERVEKENPKIESNQKLENQEKENIFLPKEVLKEENISKEINSPEFKEEYKNLEKKEQSLQKERERLQELLEKQNDISKASLTETSKKELNKLEKELEKSLEKINSLKKEQEKIIEDLSKKREEINRRELEKKIGELPSKSKKVNPKVDRKQYIKDGEKIIRRETEIKRQLDLVLNNSQNIPQEHLQNFVSNLFLNKENTIKNNSDTKRIVNEKLSNNSEEDNKRLDNLYSKLENKFLDTREKMNQEVFEELIVNQEMTNILYGESLKNDTLKQEFIKKYEQDKEKVLQEVLEGKYIKKGLNSQELVLKLNNVVQEVRKKVFEENVGIPFKKAPIEFKEYYDGSSGAYDYNDEKIRLYKRLGDDILEALNVILHETVHLEQDLIKKSDNVSIPQEVKDLYGMNLQNGGYIIPSIERENNDDYLNQPVEAEAFATMNVKEIIEKNLESFVKKNDKYSVLDKDNAFDFPKDDGIREQIVDTAGEEIIIAEYYEPLQGNPKQNKEKNNNNLETVQTSKRLGDNPLVYGTSQGRVELMLATEDSPNKVGKVGDAYLGYLNLGGSYQNLVKFAEKYSDGKLTIDDMKKVTEFSGDELKNSFSYIEREISGVSSKANKELLKELLEKKEIKEALQNISSGIKKLRKDKNNEEALKKINSGLEEFFTIKTITVLEKTLEREGQVYFSLNEIVMNGMQQVDFNKLLEVFNPNSENYNTITSKELKVVLEKYLEHPNLKFTLNKQVIELPSTIKEQIKNELKKQDKYSVLDKDNAFDFPKDDGIREQIVDTAGEEIIVAEHYIPLGMPKKSKKEKNLEESEQGRNLEKNGQSIGLGKNPLVFGTKKGKQELLQIGDKSENSISANPDNYLLKLSLGELKELAEKFSTGNLTEEDKDSIVNYKKGVNKNLLEHSNIPENRIPSEANRELLDELLKNPVVKESLKTIFDADQDPYNPEKQEAYKKAVEGFFKEQQKVLVNKTLENGGKIYVALDGIEYGDKLRVDNILKGDNGLSEELKQILKEHIGNPNLKFTLNKQVIDVVKVEGETNLKEGGSKKEKNKVKETKQEKTMDRNGRINVIRGTKDVKRNLELVAKESNNLPSEHLNNYLGKLLLNSEEKELSSKHQKNEVIVKYPDIQHDKNSASNLERIYTKIYSENNSEFRKELDSKYIQKLKNSLEVKELLKKEATEENIKVLAEIVGKLKKEVFEEIYRKEYDVANIIVKKESSTDDGGLIGNTLTIYKKPNKTLVDYLGSISHEYTHNDQRNLKVDKHIDKNQEIPYLYTINSSKNGYILPDVSVEKYKSQPVEKEAFETQKRVLEAVSKEEISEQNTERREATPIVSNVSQIKKKQEIPLNKEVHELTKIATEKLTHLEDKQLDFVASREKNEKIREELIDDFEKLKEEVEEYLEESRKLKLNKEQEIEVAKLMKRLKDYQRVNDRFVINTPAKVMEITSDKAILIQRNSDILSNLQKVAENSENIPTEHLLTYLDEVINRSSEEERAKEFKDGEGSFLTREDIEHTKESEKALNKIYEEIFKRVDNSIRKELDTELLIKLKEDEVIQKLISQKSLEDEQVLELTNRIQDIKAKIFSAKFGENYSKAKVILAKGNGEAVASNDGKTLKIDLQEHIEFENLLETVIHELTHQDQHNIKRLDKEEVKNIAKLYDMNSQPEGYITKEKEEYEKQPVEKEAYESSRKLTNNLLKKNTEEVIDKKIEKVLKKLDSGNMEIKEIFSIHSKEIKEEIISFLKENSNKDIEKLTESEIEDLIKYGKDKLLSNLIKDNNDFSVKEIGGKKVFLRGAEGVKKQLKIVANDKNKIPAEHLQNFLGNIFLNKDTTEILKKEGTETVISNVNNVKLDREDNINLTKIYEQIPRTFESSRKLMDRAILHNLGDNELLKDFITQDGILDKETLLEYFEKEPDTLIEHIYNLKINEVSDEVIEDILIAIEESRKEVFEIVTGEVYSPSALEFKDENTTESGHTIFASHNPQTGNIELNKNSLTTFGALLDTLLHETQHHEQLLISQTESSSIPKEVKEMYKINSQAYIQPTNTSMLDDMMYKSQILEREAFEIMQGKEVIKNLIQNIIK